MFVRTFNTVYMKYILLPTRCGSTPVTHVPCTEQRGICTGPLPSQPLAAIHPHHITRSQCTPSSTIFSFTDCILVMHAASEKIIYVPPPPSASRVDCGPRPIQARLPAPLGERVPSGVSSETQCLQP